ncbi:MAG: transposase, partial [Burkholderiales bacterium]
MRIGASGHRTPKSGWGVANAANNATATTKPKAISSVTLRRPTFCLPKSSLPSARKGSISRRASPKKAGGADCKSVGSGEIAWLYLARYLYRGVIQEKPISACQDRQVTFRYQHRKSKKLRTRTLPGAKFLWLILQHGLPKGFRPAPNSGFLQPNRKGLIAWLQYRLGRNPNQAPAALEKRPPLTCRCCGAPMKIVQTRIPREFACAVPQPVGSTHGSYRLGNRLF